MALVLILFFLGVFCHEALHALGALIVGAPILKFAFWPSAHPEHGFVLGYVTHGYTTNWLPTPAPYLVSLLTFPLCYGLLRRVRWGKWARLPLEALGTALPTAEFVFGDTHGLILQEGDVARLLSIMPLWAAHAFFIVGRVICMAGLIDIENRHRPIHLWHPRSG